MSKKKDDDAARTRKSTAKMMTCPECQAQMCVGDSGLVCENGCGRIFAFTVDPASLRNAWPERIIERKTIRQPTIVQLRKLRADDPMLPIDLPEKQEANHQ